MKLNSTIAAVVTGGASGLGAATVRALAGRGVRVAIFDRNAELGSALADQVGGTFCEVDIASEDSVDAAFAKARAAQGQERILVNCAGIGGAIKTVSRDRVTGEIRPYPMDVFNRVIQVNLIGTFRCVTTSAAGMMTLDPLGASGERGVMVMTASVAAEDGQIGQAAYSASKGGVVGMTLPIARDLAVVGVRVNTIAPGLIDTPIYGEGEQAEEFKARLGESVLFPKRLGVPDELASMVMECVRNSYMNAAVVRVDGGIRMPPK